MSCGTGCKLNSDSTLLWLCCRPAGVAPMSPLAWESPYTTGVALKRQKKKEQGLLFSTAPTQDLCSRALTETSPPFSSPANLYFELSHHPLHLLQHRQLSTAPLQTPWRQPWSLPGGPALSSTESGMLHILVHKAIRRVPLIRHPGPRQPS